MPVKVVILGAGGHAKVVADILRLNSDCELVGCLSPQEVGLSSKTLRIIGDDAFLPVLYEQGVSHAVIGIGDNRVRHGRAIMACEFGFTLLNAIHPTACVSDSVTLGSGVVIMPNCVVNADAHIHDNTIINTGSTVDHDCIIGESCHIAPGCAISGGVSIGDGTLIGTGASVIDGISIGEWSIVGAGAAVIHDIPANCVAFGVPARVQKWLK